MSMLRNVSVTGPVGFPFHKHLQSIVDRLSDVVVVVLVYLSRSAVVFFGHFDLLTSKLHHLGDLSGTFELLYEITNTT